MNEKIVTMMDALWQLVVKYQEAVVIVAMVLSGLGLAYFFWSSIKRQRLRIWKYMKKQRQSIYDDIKHRWLALRAWRKSNFDFNASVLSCIGLSLIVLLLYLLDSSNEEGITARVRNLFLIFSFLVGFPILIKRVAEMQKQTKISNDQFRMNQFSGASRDLRDNDIGARMASIAALWRLAQDYPEQEYANVMDFYTGFLKNPPPYELDEEGEKPTLAGKRKDIEAILGYMKRGTIKGAEKVAIDLSGSHLEGANLMDSHLEGANLMDAHLEGANLMDAHLGGANLMDVHLEGANLMDAHLEGVDLMGSSLGGANLMDAHLEGADLSWSHLEGADLSWSHLEGADLNFSHLELADLGWSIINGVDFEDATKLTQEKIDGCVFITDSKEQKLLRLHERIKSTYKRMTYEEWEKEREKRQVKKERDDFLERIRNKP